MNTKFVRFAGAASVLIGGSVALLLPGCATPMDMDSPGTDGVATVAENSEETGSTSQALTKWQAACAASVTTDYVWCYNQVNDMCLIGANMPFSGPSGISDADCRDMARKQCDPGKDKASLACATAVPTGVPGSAPITCKSASVPPVRVMQQRRSLRTLPNCCARC